MMMVERFISQVCLYGERGMPLLPSGHVYGQSVHGGVGPPVTGGFVCWCGAAIALPTSASSPPQCFIILLRALKRTHPQTAACKEQSSSSQTLTRRMYSGPGDS